MHIIRYICKTCSIRKILFAFMIIFSIIPTLCIYMLFKTYTINIVADKYINEYLMSLSSQIDYEFSSFENRLTSNYLYISLSPENLRCAESGKNTEKMLMEILADNPAIDAAQIITENALYSYSKSPGEFERPPEVSDKFLQSTGNMSFSMLDGVLKRDGKNYIVTGRRLHNYYTRKNIGYIVFYTDESYVNSLYSNLQTDNISCYITSGDTVVSCTGKDTVGKEIFAPKIVTDDDRISKNLIRTFKINGSFSNKLSIMTIATYDNLFGIMNSLGSFNSFMLALSLILSLIVSFIVSSNCLKSIRRVNKNITVFANDPTAYRPMECSGEIAAFENRFNDMVVRIKDLMKKNETEREKKHIAELCTLQSQIKHHFVYNALDIVCWKARETGQTEIEKIVIALASYFRISLSRGENYITVSDEISLVKNYVFIEKMRFNDMFDIEFDIDEALENVKILKIILQPVIENCIKHGFKNISYKGIIRVCGHLKEDGTVVFDVTDNGCGIDKDVMESAFKNRGGKIGYGLYNISERLHFEYGSGGKIEFIDTNGCGTHVRIELKK